MLKLDKTNPVKFAAARLQLVCEGISTMVEDDSETMTKSEMLADLDFFERHFLRSLASIRANLEASAE